MGPSKSRPRRRDDLSVERFDDGFVLYDAASERVIEMNATAALVWQLCDGSRSQDDIKALLRDAYPDVPTVDADVESALASFVEHGCLAP